MVARDFNPWDRAPYLSPARQGGRSGFNPVYGPEAHWSAGSPAHAQGDPHGQSTEADSLWDGSRVTDSRPGAGAAGPSRLSWRCLPLQNAVATTLPLWAQGELFTSP